MGVTIRRGVGADWPEVVRMAATWGESEHARGLIVDREHIRGAWLLGVLSEDLLCLVAERRLGSLSGVLVARKFELATGPQWAGEIAYWWVDEDARKGPSGLALLEEFHRWAEQNRLTFTKVSAHYMSRRRTRRLQRLGYEPVEIAHFRRAGD